MLVLTWTLFWTGPGGGPDSGCELFMTNRHFLRSVTSINSALPNSTAWCVCAYFFKNRSWGAKKWWRWWWRARWPTSTALTRDKEQWAALKHTQCALRFIEQSSQYETNFTIYCCSQQHRGILCNCDHQKPLQTDTQTMGTQIYFAMQKKEKCGLKRNTPTCAIRHINADMHAWKPTHTLWKHECRRQTDKQTNTRGQQPRPGTSMAKAIQAVTHTSFHFIAVFTVSLWAC